MAKVVDDSELSNGKQKYPWDQWLDGRTWRLIRNEDFRCSSEVFRTGAYAASRRRGLVTKVSIKRNGEVTLRAEKASGA